MQSSVFTALVFPYRLISWGWEESLLSKTWSLALWWRLLGAYVTRLLPGFLGFRADLGLDVPEECMEGDYTDLQGIPFLCQAPTTPSPEFWPLTHPGSQCWGWKQKLSITVGTPCFMTRDVVLQTSDFGYKLNFLLLCSLPTSNPPPTAMFSKILIKVTGPRGPWACSAQLGVCPKHCTAARKDPEADFP